MTKNSSLINSSAIRHNATFNLLIGGKGIVDTGTKLLISVVVSAIGMGYIVYGRKQMKASALVAGIALCIYPYFIHILLLNLLAGLAIMAAPFFIHD